MADGAIRIRKVSLSDSVGDYIKSMIQTGRLKLGDKLPPEREFARQLGVSRTALREAFKSLSLMGILEIKQGEGAFVSRVGPPSYMKAVGPMLLLGQTDILELVEARKILETKSAALCALRAGDEELRDIEELVLLMDGKLENVEAFNQLDLEFHLRIASAAHNSVLTTVLGTIRDLLMEQVRSVQQLPGAITRAFHFHQELSRVLRTRDSVRAERVMSEHLDDVEKAILERMLSSQQGLEGAGPRLTGTIDGEGGDQRSRAGES
ncbi:MAG: FadR/GntR family transcriptional regulator [Methanocella sp.]